MSRCPEIADLIKESGALRCCFCLKALKPNKRRQMVACWSADCRTELTAAYMRQRNAVRPALIALAKVVRSIGWSTKSLMRFEP